MSELLKAKVIATNEEIRVYRSVLRPTYIKYPQCKTEYKTKELQILGSAENEFNNLKK